MNSNDIQKNEVQKEEDDLLRYCVIIAFFVLFCLLILPDDTRPPARDLFKSKVISVSSRVGIGLRGTSYKTCTLTLVTDEGDMWRYSPYWHESEALKLCTKPQ